MWNLCFAQKYSISNRSIQVHIISSIVMKALCFQVQNRGAIQDFTIIFQSATSNFEFKIWTLWKFLFPTLLDDCYCSVHLGLLKWKVSKLEGFKTGRFQNWKVSKLEAENLFLNGLETGGCFKTGVILLRLPLCEVLPPKSINTGSFESGRTKWLKKQLPVSRPTCKRFVL